MQVTQYFSEERISVIDVYAGTVKRHNVCKRHVAIDTGLIQTERTIFLHVIRDYLYIGMGHCAQLLETILRAAILNNNENVALTSTQVSGT